MTVLQGISLPKMAKTIGAKLWPKPLFLEANNCYYEIDTGYFLIDICRFERRKL